MSARDRLVSILSGGRESQKAIMEMVADGILDMHADEMIRAIEDPEIRFGLGWESAVNVIKKMHGLGDEFGPCPYSHAHTRHWCGYEQCRES